jgi:hypothetical protein
MKPGQALYQMGDLVGVLKIHQRQESICREGNRPASVYLIGQALILRELGSHDQAIQLLDTAELEFVAQGEWQRVSQCLNVQFQIRWDMDDYVHSMNFLRRQEAVCHKHKIAYGLAESLANQAMFAISVLGVTFEGRVRLPGANRFDHWAVRSRNFSECKSFDLGKYSGPRARVYQLSSTGLQPSQPVA